MCAPSEKRECSFNSSRKEKLLIFFCFLLFLLFSYLLSLSLPPFLPSTIPPPVLFHADLVSPDFIPGTVLSASYMNSLIYFSQQPPQVLPVFNYILQMKKLKIRKSSWLAQSWIVSFYLSMPLLCNTRCTDKLDRGWRWDHVSKRSDREVRGKGSSSELWAMSHVFLKQTVEEHLALDFGRIWQRSPFRQRKHSQQATVAQK